MRGHLKTIGLGVAVFACLTSVGFAQRSPDVPKPPGSNSEQIPAVTPQDGISREQADAILAELRQIRHLLESQSAASPPESPPERVRVNVGEHWHAIGNGDAPVTMVEFTDLQCTFCRRFHADTFPEIKKVYIDTGKVRFVSRDMPLKFHQHAVKAAEAARCAGEQGKFWEMRNAILESTLPPTENLIVNLAKTLVPEFAAFRTCLDSEKYKEAIQKDIDEADALEISGTPTFVLARSAKDILDGVRMVGAQSFPDFQRRIDELLKVEPAK